MQRTLGVLVSLILTAAVLLLSDPRAQSQTTAPINEQAEQLFVRRVAPLFHEKCLEMRRVEHLAVNSGCKPSRARLTFATSTSRFCDCSDSMTTS